MTDGEIDRYWAGVRERATAMGFELPTLDVQEVPLDSYMCPHCGFYSLMQIRVVAMSSDGLQCIRPEIECARPICPSNNREVQR